MKRISYYFLRTLEINDVDFSRTDRYVFLYFALISESRSLCKLITSESEMVDLEMLSCLNHLIALSKKETIPRLSQLRVENLVRVSS